jgi:tetratricopeptide (TPR) repeat protein/O-antigen ligase
MRSRRLAFLLLAFYLVLIGGGAYYYQFFAFRVLHHAVASFILIVWAAGRLRSGLPDTPLNLPIYAVVLVWFIGAVFSLDPRTALENLWFPLTHVGIFFILADLIQRGREKWVFEALFLVAGVVVIIALAQGASWLLGLGITPDTRTGWLETGILPPLESPMLYLPMGVSTWLAAWVAPLIIVAAVWGWTAFRRANRVPLWMLAAGLLFVLLGTTSRGGLIALAASAAVFIGLRVLDQARKRLDPRLIVGVVGVGALIAGALAAVLLIGQSEARWTGDMLRVNLWRGALAMIQDDPLTGVGAGLFGRAYRLIREPFNVDNRLGTAHNAYLNGAAENGLLGVIAGGWLAGALIWAWWRARTRAEGGRRLRLDACMAALGGLAAQSLFDSFTMSAMVAPMLALAAYCVVPPGSALDRPINRRGRIPAAVYVGGMAVYALAFIPIDLAHSRHLASLRESSAVNALAAAREAAALDPYLNLYALQAAHLEAIRAVEIGALDAAIRALERGTALEPTWDVGWINLGGLYERAGRFDEALSAFDRARQIDSANAGSLNWARLADAHNLASDEEIIAAYLLAFNGDLTPTSPFWLETPRRAESLRQFITSPTNRVDLRYRAAAALMPDEIAGVRASFAEPVTAREWWVVGEMALASGDAARAVDAFSASIALERGSGDGYVARARAYTALRERAKALDDLRVAELLVTQFENIGATRLALADPADDLRALRARALPLRVIDQNFEGVLFAGRVASFDLLLSVRYPGPSRAVMSPWYDLAADYAASGDIDAAINVYRAILDYAPAQTEALDLLNALVGAA